MSSGTLGFEVDAELLKLLAVVFALFISTVTVEFRIAAFINDKRDRFPDRRVGMWCTFGEIYDWFWGYLLGFVFNFLLFLVAHQIHRLTLGSEYAIIGKCVYWLYLLNVIFWGVGFIIDAIRLLFPGLKRETAGTEPATADTTTRTTRSKED